MPYRALTDADVDHFTRKGYVKIEGAFPRDVADAWAAACFERLGYDKNDKATWAETRIHMGGDKFVLVKEFAPRVYDAITDLVGGEDRLAQPCRWSDHFIVNLGIRADEPWQPAGPDTPGWHKDGDFFRHFLDSPEQGLLVFVNWTDVVHQGGPTYIATDSVPVVAQFLAAHPEGVLPGGFNFPGLVGQCREFEEATARAGDVYLLHPFVLHAASQNPLRLIRIITNPPVHLTEPLRFNRAKAADFSPVELGVLAGLGVDRYDFAPTMPRERVVPERVKRQERMQQEERERARQAEAPHG
ncbi:MAG: phytanoyl-CoA dioxygenase family protein [Fimbriimonadaceae bacterium]